MPQIPPKSNKGTPPAMPRWVKVFVSILIVLVVVVVVLHLTGNNLGGHIPHMP